MTEAILTALLEGIYTCWKCGEKDIFEVGEDLPVCPSCGQQQWDCQIDDNREPGWSPIPLCFMHGTMSFVIAVSEPPAIGECFNIKLQTRSRLMGETEWTTHMRMNGSYTIPEVVPYDQTQQPIRPYDLNGHAGFWVFLKEVGTIDRSQPVHIAFPV